MSLTLMILFFAMNATMNVKEVARFILLLLVKNKQVERSLKDDTRAEKTTPWPLSICWSKVTGAGMGVWADAHLPKGLLFGPYEGVILNDVKPGEESGYGWRIRSSDHPGKCIDAIDPSNSNWLRFVNCSRNFKEMNLQAFQYREEIYYKTSCSIRRGAELMVWYGDEYGAELGLKLDREEGNQSKGNSSKNGNQKQPIKFGIRKTKGIERISLPADDIYGTLAYKLIPAEPKKFINESFHTSEDNSNKDPKFHCSVCNKFFTTKKYLNNHSQIHSGKFSSMCQYCGKGFSNIRDLVRHIRIHTGEKPFQCSECGERFNQKIHLKTHLLIHTGEKPHQCLVCKKRFSRSSHLILHNNSIHLKIKSFKCSFCEKRFSENGTLKRHERIHTGEKPFECKICLKRFTDRSSLKRHKRTHK